LKCGLGWRGRFERYGDSSPGLGLLLKNKGKDEKRTAGARIKDVRKDES
jgi:hypothetical protein